MSRFLRTPFVSALAGGLVVAVLGWAGIAAGWVEAGDERPIPDAVPTPLTEPAVEQRDAALSVNEIYSRDAPGVVFVQARGRAEAPAFSPFGPPGGPGSPGTAAGSGFVVDDEGHILTNAHVVDGAQEVSVRLTDDGEALDAEVVGADTSTDVAVLRVEAASEELHPLALGESSQVRVGDPVVAIGNPFGLDRTATAGIVSAVQRQIEAPNGFTISDAIQTDAAINPGNSGGPLLDATGRVIGINSQIESPGGGNVGIGFAVPIDTVEEIAGELISSGSVEHAFLGISGADLTAEVADVLNLDAEQGVIVQDVVADSPADEAGIAAARARVRVDGVPVRAGGDVIIAVEGRPVGGMDEVIATVDAKQPGDSLELTLLRDGERQTVEVELGDRPAQASP